jgi:hypothetical protein
MMNSTQFVILKTLTKLVLDGKNPEAPRRLAFFSVYRSGNLTRCKQLLGQLQITLGSSDRGLRLLDAQLEIEKLLECPLMAS